MTDKSTTILPLPVSSLYFILFYWRPRRRTRLDNRPPIQQRLLETQYASGPAWAMRNTQLREASPNVSNDLCSGLNERKTEVSDGDRQVCSKLSIVEGEPSLRGVGGFLTRCQLKSKLNSLHLRRATQWAKRTVWMEVWTLNSLGICCEDTVR